MATYTYPTNIRLAPKTISFTAKSTATTFTSPFTGKSQTVNYSGQWWELTLTYAPLFQSDAEELMAFYNRLGGKMNDFYFKLPSKFLMTGTVSPTMNANGNDFTGATGQTGKFGVSDTYRLIQFTSTSSLFPRLPSTPGPTIGTTNGAKLRLANNDVTFDVNELMLYGTTVALIENI